MKNYLILIFILSFCACSNPQKIENKAVINSRTENTDNHKKTKLGKTEEKEIIFFEMEGEAVLIGEKIELLDDNLQVIADISSLSGKIVNIKGVSDSLFNQGMGFKEFCKSFWYVKVQNDTINGIVNGRQVFKILDLKPDEKFTIDKNSYEFYRTEFFGMGVEYQGDLMGCPVDQPIVLKNLTNNYYGLVSLIQNENSKKASWGTTFSYFELKNDDGGYDKIETLFTEGENIKLKVKRSFQEGENESIVLLSFVNGKYKAEYLDFGKVKY